VPARRTTSSIALFRRAGLEEADPRSDRISASTIGKMKRVRDVLAYAAETDPEAGGKLVDRLHATMRACGCFRLGSQHFPDAAVMQAAREALTREGYELDRDGHAPPALLEGLEGAQLTAALWAYVRRARAGSRDAQLVVGTNKDLIEATARHVLVETTGAYHGSMNFPATLYQAFDRLGLAAAPPAVAQRLSTDPHAQFEQPLYLLAVNRLRNAEGTGHGRPSLASVGTRQARLLNQASGLVSQCLLDRLTPELASTQGR
jgi:Abortive infection C-terminus